MRILAISDCEYSGDKLDTGSYYFVQKDDSGSLLQNSLFHGLLSVYFTSGMHSYPIDSFEDLKNQIKLKLGAGYKSYVFIEATNKGYRKGRVDNFDDVPDNIALDENGKKMLWGELKSWSLYTKKERTNLIQNLIVEMINVGVSSKKFNDILKTLEENNLNRAVN